ncbi:13483_t:CDS:2 [Ambispora leptoticha]|uniref:13483_t:CDS:1 n=1 Tax=Ambispora leptoticha TaxID=144679 RepID=A0A9N8WM62_9GLOM|nr:13483_t:CDS:2 [Ambispora leptoticha]
MSSNKTVINAPTSFLGIKSPTLVPSVLFTIFFALFINAYIGIHISLRVGGKQFLHRIRDGFESISGWWFLLSLPIVLHTIQGFNLFSIIGIIGVTREYGDRESTEEFNAGRNCTKISTIGFTTLVGFLLIMTTFYAVKYRAEISSSQKTRLIAVLYFATSLLLLELVYKVISSFSTSTDNVNREQWVFYVFEAVPELISLIFLGAVNDEVSSKTNKKSHIGNENILYERNKSPSNKWTQSIDLFDNFKGPVLAELEYVTGKPNETKTNRVDELIDHNDDVRCIAKSQRNNSTQKKAQMLETAQMSIESPVRNSPLNTPPIQARPPKRHMRSNTHQGLTSSQRFTPLSDHHPGVANGINSNANVGISVSSSPTAIDLSRPSLYTRRLSSPDAIEKREGRGNEENNMPIESHNLTAPLIDITVVPPTPTMIKPQPPRLTTTFPANDKSTIVNHNQITNNQNNNKSKNQPLLRKESLDGLATLPSPDVSNLEYANNKNQATLTFYIEQQQLAKLGLPKSTQIIGHYAVIKPIGKGSFSEVKLAIDLKSGEKFALKMIPTEGIETDDRIKSSVSREVELLKLMDHPNIVRLHDTVDTPTHLCLVMEYVLGGELFDHVCKNYEQTTETDAKRIFLQLVDVVAYLHGNNIIHRDLKLENILLTELYPSPTGPIIKLTDFGLARFIDPSSPILTTRCGSEEYAAPELLINGKYDGRQTDIWSLGIILYVLLVGYLPFDLEPGQTKRQFYYKIAQANYKFPKPEKESGRRATISEEAKDLVKMILQSNPKRRATLDQIKQHRWLNE